MDDVANPGSALGEAIGALLEDEIHRILKPLAETSNCVYIATGPNDPRTGKPTKLILEDGDGNEYNIDSVIINNRFQPLVLVESKYIRYKKHNRDKASWVWYGSYQITGALWHSSQVHCDFDGQLESPLKKIAPEF
jgi:hypothetical protein